MSLEVQSSMSFVQRIHYPSYKDVKTISAAE